MKFPWRGPLITILLSVGHPTWAQPTPAADSIDAYVRTQMLERRIPGMAIAVIRHGRTEQLRTYGLASVEFGLPVTPSTPFSVASISKSVTAVAVMTFVEAGALRLDSPIGSHLRDLPPAWRTVTVRQLLSHTSGLPDMQTDEYTTRTIAADRGETLRLLKDRPLEFAPGSRWRYNQTNYMLLGMLVEALGERSYARFCEERLFKPFSLRNVSFGDARTIVEGRATTYTKFRFEGGPPATLDRAEVLNAEMPSMAYPAAGLNISIADFARWLTALLNGEILAQDSLDLLWTPTELNDGSTYRRAPAETLWQSYGLGWIVGTAQPRPFVGGTGGLRSAFFLYPEDDLAVIVLTNLQGSAPESLVDGIARHYLQ